MDYPTRLDFCDGKYTVIYDFSTGQSECLRYGQPWRQLVGDKMVLAMFDRVVELQAENAALKADMLAQQVVIEKMLKFVDFVENAPVASGVCCCGDSMENHAEPMSCGHSPVDQWEYSLMGWTDTLQSIQPDLTALREHDVEVVKKFAKWADSPSATMWAKHYIERIRKGEA